MLKSAFGTADKIIADAKEKAAESAGPVNFISARTLGDRKRVHIQMNIGGEPGQWIEYDASQLDELIRMLQTHRLDLK